MLFLEFFYNYDYISRLLKKSYPHYPQVYPQARRLVVWACTCYPQKSGKSYQHDHQYVYSHKCIIYTFI